MLSFKFTYLHYPDTHCWAGLSEVVHSISQISLHYKSIQKKKKKNSKSKKVVSQKVTEKIINSSPR